MGLRDRFKENVRPAEPAEKDPHRARTNGNGNGNGHVATAPAPSLNDRSQGLKARIHRRMVERINLASLESVEPERLRFQIRQIISALLAEESIPLSEAERLALEEEVLNETFGLGTHRARTCTIPMWPTFLSTRIARFTSNASASSS
jgi:hypothetical protein